MSAKSDVFRSAARVRDSPGALVIRGVNNGIVHIGSSVFSVLVHDCGDWTKVG